MNDENEQLKQEIRELKNWKRQQILLWDDVDRYIRFHPEANIGHSVASKALQFLRERDELVEYKKDIENSFKSIMSERGPNDEVHCSCVPFLKIKIKELENKIIQLQLKNISINDRLNEERRISGNLSAAVSDLCIEIEGWKNKWKYAVEMAAIAENKLDTIKNAL